MADAHDAAAAAVRRLGHALVAHDADAATLREIADAAQAFAARVETAARAAAEPIDLGIPPDGAAIEHPARCPISGPANPLAPVMTARRDGSDVWCETTLGPAHEGYPGRAHGGVVAALFDDATAFATRLTGEQCFAVDLQVSYRAAVPIGVPLAVRAWVDARDGRKVFTRAEIAVGGSIVAEARCLKLVARPAAPVSGDGTATG